VVMRELGYYYSGHTANSLVVRSSSCIVENSRFVYNRSTAVSVENATALVRNNVFGWNSYLDVSVGAHNLVNVTGNGPLAVGLRNEAMTSDAVLTSNNNYYYLLANLTVATGRTLTVQPGVTLQFPENTSTLTVQGTLTAVGTLTDSIRFTGGGIGFQNQRGPIVVENNSVNSQFKYIIVDRLGYYYNSESSVSIKIRSSSVNMGNSSFLNTNGLAIGLENNSQPTIQNNSFSNNSGGDISGLANQFTNVKLNNAARVLILPGTIAQSCSLPNPGNSSNYVLTGTVTVNTGANLGIAPGSIIDLRNNSSNLVVNGSLTAAGTETEKIQFKKITSAGNTSAGGTISFGAASSGSVITNAIIDRLGNTTAPAKGSALELNTAAVSINNVNFSNSANYGARINSANPVFLNCNFLNNPTGAYIAGGKPVFTGCSFVGNTQLGVNNASAVIADTADARNCWWGMASGPRYSTNPGGTGDSISNRVKYAPFDVQVNPSLVPDLGINNLLSPVSKCNLGTAEVIKVVVSNYSNVSQTGFILGYKINNNSPVIENVPGLTIAAGGSVEYSFTQTANLSAPGSYQVNCFTAIAIDTFRLNDSLYRTVQYLTPPPKPANLVPVNNAANLTTAINFSWGTVSGADYYDFYIWKSTDAVPTTPVAANLTQINYLYNSGLAYGTAYRWKVIAKTSNCTVSSDVQNFTTKFLPDLVVDSIEAPIVAVSETEIEIQWRIKNKEKGQAAGDWADDVYLSDAPVLGVSNDYFIGSYPRIQALDSGQLYPSQRIRYKLPQGITGNYYVIVKTDPYNAVFEKTDTNNIRVSKVIQVSLLPPPDLQVTSVVVSPSTAFSEDPITVTWTVENRGTGAPTTTTWQDRVYLSASPVLDVNSATILYDYTRNGTLAVNGIYTEAKQLSLPAYISDTFYVHVRTDRLNQVYEATDEQNNTRVSLPINVILRPTPDLAVSNVSVAADTVSVNQPLAIFWAERNDGAATAQPSWTDEIILSADTVYNPGTDIILGNPQNELLVSLASRNVQSQVLIPANQPQGSYYFFTRTDRNNQVFEANRENNNVSRYSNPVYIARPDLQPVQVGFPATAKSEQSITINWTVNNIARGWIYNGNWTDRIYLSADAVFNPSTDLLLLTSENSGLFAAGSSYNRQQAIELPVGLQGSFFVFVSSDAFNGITEVNEGNNVYQSATRITITLSPWPDLRVTAVNPPTLDTVATPLSFSYTVKNFGPGGILNKAWRDEVYLSPTNSFTDPNRFLLNTVELQQSLDSGANYTRNLSYTLPVNLPPGTYYLQVFSDTGKTVFENTVENNNALMSAAIQIAPLPNVDLATVSGSVSSGTVVAGQNINVQFTVRNAGTINSIVPYWEDAIYLSNNPILDASDRLLGVWGMSRQLPAGATYTQNKTITIPVDASGALYLIAVADRNNNQNDVVRNNNNLALNIVSNPGGGGGGDTIIITPAPASDLVPQTFTAPASAFVSQPVTLVYTITNIDTGITSSSVYTDAVYLASGYQLANAQQIGSKVRTTALAPGASYTDTLQVFLPANKTGNYLLTLKTDAGNNVYEPNGEQNNLAYSSIFIQPQQPCDVLVTHASVLPDTVLSGQNVLFNWTAKNNGINPANGFIRDAVYLSADSVWDNNDRLVGTTEGNVNILPQNSINRQLTASIAGLDTGAYRVIVRTDILNNLTESNENNNSTTGGQLYATMKRLLMDIVTPDSLRQNTPLYYRLVIPDSLAGQTLQLTLKGDSLANAVNRLFIQYGTVPTVNIYEAAGQVPLTANQQLLIPELRAGTYYILATGNKPNGTMQPITLQAKIIYFQVSAVQVNKGGNSGMVTVKINGAKFDPACTARLIKGNNIISAVRMFYVNSTELYASFNLQGAALGLYDVNIKKQNGDSASLANGFEIIPGSGGGIAGSGSANFTCNIQNIGFENNLDTDVLHPESTRPNRVVLMTIAYANTGNVDIQLPRRFIISLGGAPLSFSTSFDDNLQNLPLEFAEAGGPPDVLRAGGSGTIRVYSIATAPLRFTIAE
jgi:CARDB